MNRAFAGGVRTHVNQHSGYSRTYCGYNGAGLRNESGRECTGLAMGMIKRQSWQDVYPCEKAITRGTIFAELDLPFLGGKAGSR